MSVLRIAAGLIMLFVVAAGVPSTQVSAGSQIENLYQAQTIVTGSDERNRGSGMAACLEEVLVKVSGDPALFDEPAVDALAPKAPEFVESFRYHDRMSGIPTHDEQGSRDRPYDLIVDFVPEKIDSLLRSLGREPWPADRPVVAVLLAMRNSRQNFVISADGPRNLERESLMAAAARRGIPMVLPDEAALPAGPSIEAAAGGDPDLLDALARQAGGEVALIGTMTWDETAITWVADWHLRGQGKSWRWQGRSETFDEAFRQAMGGAAQALSGNRQPD